METKNTRNHIVDILFVLALFGMFTLSALLVIILGSHIYQKTIDDMNKNYTTRTSYSYISEKIRQSSENGNISVIHNQGSDILCITQTLQDTKYCTYLYESNGVLKECFIREENEFNRDQGTDILPISHLHIEELENQLLHIHYYNEAKQYISLYIHVTC